MKLKTSLIYLLVLLCSCDKINVEFAEENTTGDPNILFFDDYPVELSTYKVDSFVTSNHDVFTIGHHADNLFGSITGGSYAAIDLPLENPLHDQNVSFDSLIVMLRPNKSYYGDTSLPFKLNVHRLLEKIENDDADNSTYFNPRSFQYDPVLLGQKNGPIRPTRDTTVNIRLSDAFGQDLLTKFKNNSTEVQSTQNFSNYFKGLFFGTDTMFSNSLYYFKSDSGKIMRLYYTLNGTVPEKTFLDFSMSSTKQFNSVFYSHAGTNLSVFTPYKTQLKKSSLTGNKAYLNTPMGSYIKINFPTILNIKELSPYVKIVKAELIIKPNAGTYNFPYTLPPYLVLYATDDGNGLNGLLADPASQVQAPATGNLYIDDLYGEKTQYTFDITNFISDIVNEGLFSKTALMLTPVLTTYDKSLERLILNDQGIGKNIQLNLYVLTL